MSQSLNYCCSRSFSSSSQVSRKVGRIATLLPTKMQFYDGKTQSSAGEMFQMPNKPNFGMTFTTNITIEALKCIPVDDLIPSICYTAPPPGPVGNSRSIYSSSIYEVSTFGGACFSVPVGRSSGRVSWGPCLSSFFSGLFFVSSSAVMLPTPGKLTSIKKIFDSCQMFIQK